MNRSAMFADRNCNGGRRDARSSATPVLGKIVRTVATLPGGHSRRRLI